MRPSRLLLSVKSATDGLSSAGLDAYGRQDGPVTIDDASVLAAMPVRRGS